MNLEQLDELLRRYTEAEQRIAATLVELEARPTYKLVMNGPLQGVTRARVQPAVDAAPGLWRSFDAFREVLDKARIVRGDRHKIDDEHRRELESLLTGPSIVTDVAQLPVDQRELLGPSVHETAITPEQLLTTMTATFAAVTDGIGAVEQVWRDIVPRVDAANAALTRLDTAAAPLNAIDEPALASLRDAIRAIESTLADDPLAIDATATARLDAALAIAETRIAELTTGRASLGDDLARAGAMLVDLRRLHAEATAAASEAAAKITDAVVVEVADAKLIDGLAAELNRVQTLSDGWQKQRRSIDAWFVRAEPLRDELNHALATNRAPLERRNELRGLLSAYRSKASDTGVAEDERIAALVRAAHQQLHTAPTDLSRAQGLVTELGAALRRPGAR